MKIGQVSKQYFFSNIYIKACIRSKEIVTQGPILRHQEGFKVYLRNIVGKMFQYLHPKNYIPTICDITMQAADGVGYKLLKP